MASLLQKMRDTVAGSNSVGEAAKPLHPMIALAFSSENEGRSAKDNVDQAAEVIWRILERASAVELRLRNLAEGAVEKLQLANDRIHLLEAERRLAEARAHQAEARKEEVETHIQETEARVQEADVRAQQAEERTKQAEQRAEKAEEKLNWMELRVAVAENRISEAELRAKSAVTRASEVKMALLRVERMEEEIRALRLGRGGEVPSKLAIAA
jgi:chromosome segregation ATPase